MTKHLPDYPSLPHSDNPFIFNGSFKVTSKVQLIGLWKLIKNRAKIHLQEKLAKRDFQKCRWKIALKIRWEHWNDVDIFYFRFNLSFKIVFLSSYILSKTMKKNWTSMFPIQIYWCNCYPMTYIFPRKMIQSMQWVLIVWRIGNVIRILMAKWLHRSVAPSYF